MVSKTRIFLVLMWKKWIVRLSTWWWYFPLEIIVPSVFFLLMFLLRSYIVTVGPHAGSNNVQHTEPFSLDQELVSRPLLIMYTPETPLTNALMDEVGAKMNLKRLNMFDHNVRGYYSFPNGTLDLNQDFVKNMKESTALVIFNDMDGKETWPTRLNYTIRLKTDFKTHIYESLDDDIGPHSRFGTIYESFMRVQWAIDSSYLKLSGSDDIPTLTLQEFPYVDTRTRKEASFICDLIKHCCYFSLILIFIFIVNTQIAERSSGIQELLRMSGVTRLTWGASELASAAPAGCWFALAGAVFLTASSLPLLLHSSAVIVFVALFLYYVTIVGLAFVTSYVITSVTYGTTFAAFLYVITLLPESYIRFDRLWRPFFYLSCFLPHIPLNRFWDEVGALETYGKGLTFSNMAERHSSLPVLLCLVFLVIQCNLWFTLAWYLSFVRPGPHGVALPWNFCLQRKTKVDPDELDDESEPIVQDKRYFESPPHGAQAGITITNVNKLYGSQRALSNVSFEVYRGEITVLLGHNGAGKTTLMSIITGMFSPTSGTVCINGEDVTGGACAGRVAFCPQHQVLFPQLSVMAHAMFFALLSGQSFDQARKSSKQILESVGLEQAAELNSKQLSGGMLRRAQLVCALAGGADVLVLDEPTSGLDVETRRELWDLLLALRGERTVLLSTHFMEEADALGDRVAALHSGTLRCYATPMHLKKNIGTGYRLSLTTVGCPKETAITSTITSIIPDAILKEKTFSSVSFSLPSQYSHKFPTLFSELESKRPELGVDSIGVGVSTLEEVFLKLCSDSTAPLTDDTVDGDDEDLKPTGDLLTGLPLIFRQIVELTKRQVAFILNAKMNFLVFQVVLPLFLLLSVSIPLNETDVNHTGENIPTAMDLDIYSTLPERRVLYSVNASSEEALRVIRDRYKTVHFTEAPDGDVAKEILRIASQDVHEYNKYIVGIELDDANAKVWYTTGIRHAAPTGLNLLSNVLAASPPRSPQSPRAIRLLTTVNSPLMRDEPLQNLPVKQPKPFLGSSVWVLFMVSVILITESQAMNIMSLELKHGTRHLLAMAGVAPLTHFGATVAFFTALYAAITVIPAVLCGLTDSQETLSQPGFIVCLFVIFMLGTVGFITFCYVFSIIGCGSLLLFLYIVFFGAVSGTTKAQAEIMGQTLGSWDLLLNILEYASPAHTFVAASIKATQAATLNAMCSLNRDVPQFCSKMIRSGGGASSNIDGFDVNKCCVENTNVMPYFTIGSKAAGKETIILVAQIVVMTTIIWIHGRGVFGSLAARFTRWCCKPPVYPNSSDMVRAEYTYVNQAATLPPKQISDTLLVHNVYKNFFRFLRPNKPAEVVKGVSFSVKKGECFGILGVNGAGKTTLFKTITGQYFPTQGTVFANRHQYDKPRGQYLHSLAHCPQLRGVDAFLTGRQALELALAVRGVRADAARRAAAAWLAVVGLERHADARARGYSGGCQRRLAAAAALCGGAPAALLDEPTSGVDVGARRRVWAALRRGLRGGRAVLITSHSMDEMEALCQRIAIVAQGRVQALGSAAQLRADHAKGHALSIKIHALGYTADETDSTDIVSRLKSHLHQNFDCTLKDEHKTMLHYHINETVPYSALFATLEEMRGQFPDLVEDYAVTETTLEEVFLSFANNPQQVTTVEPVHV